MDASWDARSGDRIATGSAPELVSGMDGSPDFRAWAVPAPGLVAGRYRLRSQPGCGSMGVVWLAQDNLPGWSVALMQVLRGPGSVKAPMAALSRARTEARTVARVDHPDVLRIHDLVEDDGSMWLVTELLSGCTMGEALGADGSLPIGAVRKIGLGLLDAAGYE